MSWLRRWGPIALIGVAAVGTFICQATYNGESKDHKHIWLLYLATVLVLVAAVTPAVNEVVGGRRRVSSEQRVSRARTDEVVAMNDALDPLVESLGRLVSLPPNQRQTELGSLITQALNSAKERIGRSDRTRVSFFGIDNESSPRQMSCRGSAGRAGSPTTLFVEGEEEGDAVFEQLQKDEVRLCRDIKASPPPGFDTTRERSYVTFLSAPARVGRTAVGMMTADSPKKGSLRSQDASLLRVIGTIVACGAILVGQDEEPK